jgi:hypothetical protein
MALIEIKTAADNYQIVGRYFLQVLLSLHFFQRGSFPPKPTQFKAGFPYDIP